MVFCYLPFSQKRSIMDVWQGRKYAYELSMLVQFSEDKLIHLFHISSKNLDTKKFIRTTNILKLGSSKTKIENVDDLYFF